MNNIKNNKFESNKKYFTICIYTLFVILIGTLIIKLIISWNETKSSLNSIISAITPFLIGAFIAYLLNPLMKYLDKKLLRGLFKIKSAKASKYSALALSYLFVIGIIYICFSYIIPQFMNSITELVQAIPAYYESIYDFLNNLEANYPNIDFNYINNLLVEAEPNLINTLKSFASNALPLIYTTGVSVIKGLLNMIIAIIVSIYMLSDKETISKNFKRMLYAFIPDNICDTLMRNLSECNKIFSSFIIGKSIDSLIIGIICFVSMSIFRMPYALIISVIVGVTNMIPYFGPFIGAVPGTLILILISPFKALGFLVLILVLQQFDGLYLGPKILGSSTGLKPLWIIIAITIGGNIAGVIGMFFGVPIMAVFAYLANNVITKRLNDKNKPNI